MNDRRNEDRQGDVEMALESVESKRNDECCEGDRLVGCRGVEGKDGSGVMTGEKLYNFADAVVSRGDESTGEGNKNDVENVVHEYEAHTGSGRNVDERDREDLRDNCNVYPASSIRAAVSSPSCSVSLVCSTLFSVSNSTTSVVSTSGWDLGSVPNTVIPPHLDVGSAMSSLCVTSPCCTVLSLATPSCSAPSPSSVSLAPSLSSLLPTPLVSPVAKQCPESPVTTSVLSTESKSPPLSVSKPIRPLQIPRLVLPDNLASERSPMKLYSPISPAISRSPGPYSPISPAPVLSVGLSPSVTNADAGFKNQYSPVTPVSLPPLGPYSPISPALQSLGPYSPISPATDSIPAGFPASLASQSSHLRWVTFAGWPAVASQYLSVDSHPGCAALTVNSSTEDSAPKMYLTEKGDEEKDEQLPTEQRTSKLLGVVQWLSFGMVLMLSSAFIVSPLDFEYVH